MRNGFSLPRPRSLIAAGWLFMGIPTAEAADNHCYRVEKVDFWDVLYIRSRPDHRSAAVGAIAPDHNGIVRATGACRPAGVSRRRQWCPVDYFPLPDVRESGFVKAYFVKSAPCPKARAEAR